MKATPYLIFNGNCKAAMAFYKKCLGGELYSMTFGETQGPQTPDAVKDKLIHARLNSGDLVLMASDDIEGKTKFGDSVQLSVDCKDVAELEKAFTALSEKGTVKLALNDTFWGARFGMLVDQFGIHWMLSYEYPKKK